MAKTTQTIDSPTAPAQDCFPIDPAISEDLPKVTKAIFVGNGGDVTLRLLRASADVTFRNLPTGYMLDVRAIAIRNAGTSAANLVGLA